LEYYLVTVDKHSASASTGCTYSVSKSSARPGDTAVTFTATVNSGYTFQGWYSSASSTSSSYLVSTSATFQKAILSNTTLYAYWTQDVTTYDCTCDYCERYVG